MESVAQPLAVRMDHCHRLWTWSVRKINTNWANAGSNNAITIILLSVTLFVGWQAKTILVKNDGVTAEQNQTLPNLAIKLTAVYFYVFILHRFTAIQAVSRLFQCIHYTLCRVKKLLSSPIDQIFMS